MKNRGCNISFIVAVYILLFMPALFFLLTNRVKAQHGFKAVIAFSPALVIAVFTLFSVHLIQINQHSIEIVGMALWQEKVFVFKKESFPNYYFPQHIWGMSKVIGAERLFEGMEFFQTAKCTSSVQNV